MNILADSTDAQAVGLGIWLMIAIGIVAYWIPTIVASRRKTVNAGGVFVVNLFFGWTLLGWVVALAMASGGAVKQPVQQAQQVVYYQHPQAAPPPPPQVPPPQPPTARDSDWLT